MSEVLIFNKENVFVLTCWMGCDSCSCRYFCRPHPFPDNGGGVRYPFLGMPADGIPPFRPTS